MATITNSVELTLEPYTFGYWNVSDMYGGKKISLHIHGEVLDSLKWIQEYRARLDQEQQMRAENPALQELYDQYQTMMGLLKTNAT